jgi:hypothetical protein
MKKVKEKRKFDIMLKDLGMNYRQLAEILGLEYTSVVNQCAPAKKLPKWAISMLHVWELYND